MKKLLPILLLFIIVNGFSQDLIIRYNGVVYNNNDTMYVSPRFLNSDDTYYIDIENNTSQQLGIMVLRDPISLLIGATTQFCIGESCLEGNVSIFPQVINAGENYSHASAGDQAFHINYNPNGHYGSSTLKYTLYDQTNTSISTVFYMVIDNTEAIQNNVAAVAINAYPNPATSKVTFEHSIPGLQNGSLLVIRNITGVVVYSEMIANNPKTIVSIENFNSGIYFYSIEVNGKAIATKKLIIK
jgi:hypothetical protein